MWSYWLQANASFRLFCRPSSLQTGSRCTSLPFQVQILVVRWQNITFIQKGYLLKCCCYVRRCVVMLLTFICDIYCYCWKHKVLLIDKLILYINLLNVIHVGYVFFVLTFIVSYQLWMQFIVSSDCHQLKQLIHKVIWSDKKKNTIDFQRVCIALMITLKEH